jgi:hypothetical protein
MLPHEQEGNIAKILFFIFATCMFCLSKARAYDLDLVEAINSKVEIINSLISLG